MEKLGRNEKCWCGSGQKFKRCHLGREREEPIKPWEISATQRKNFSQRLCSAPESFQDKCSGSIVAAHTIPRSGSLNQIADDGHVMAFIPTLDKLIKHNGVLQPERVGVRRASTFTGFCSFHDDGLFSSLEKSHFAGSQEQCFLLAYRAYAREIYTRRAAAKQSDLLKGLDRGRSADRQMAIQAFAHLHEAGIDAALRDIEIHKPRFDQCLTSQDFSSVRSYIIELDEAPPVMCSATYAPTLDFAGMRLQDMADLTLVPALMSVTSFFGGEKGYIVFTWMEADDNCCAALIKSLEMVNDVDLTTKLVEFFFDYFENVFASPLWWDAIGKSNQDALVQRMIGEIGVAFKIVPKKKPPIKIAPWAISRRYRVGF
ncbi:TPA: SEC-C domain-containing protein [Pseudomonas aeruginosa]|nr:cytoplasmic protein [Pseudomonas aeruginosa]HBO2162656.1 SEC-C domain-containing protein [Pseudomonas aeruginosa]HBO2165974.1 SEC-C domain-containing protein [Pseudomonas aeruginosa]HBO4860708.1 SEC-C domain-containing protein [Pseudomonas aeruginosa]HBO4986514.1 SEC-C domain-containing protein [Pseudomonas aeruginosa]